MADLHIYLPGILLAYSVLLVGIVSPGPAVLAIIGTSMERGRMPGVQLATGVVCGSAFWGVMAAAGMAAIMTTYATLLTIIKIAGGIYLLWLAWKSLRTALAKPSHVGQAPEARQGEGRKMFLTGLFIHLTNPKAILAWIATIALGVTADTPIWVSYVIVSGGILISLIGNLSYALVFSTGPMARMYLRAKRPIAWVFAGFFGFAGLRLLMSRN